MAQRRPAEHQAVLRRDDRQPGLERPRRRGRRGRGARGRRPAGRRQHRADALPAAPDRARRRHRHPLGDQVPRRSRHDDRGRGRRRRHVRLRRARRPLPRLHRARPELQRAQVLGGPRPGRVRGQAARPAAARHRRGDRPVQRLPHHPGHRDALAAPRAPRAERAGPGRVARAARRGREGLLRGPALEPLVRGRQEVPAPRRRRDRVVRPARRGRGRARVRRRHHPALAAGEHRRRPQPHRPPGVDDAQPALGERAGVRGRHPGPGAPGRGHRARRGPEGRPRGGLHRGQVSHV